MGDIERVLSKILDANRRQAIFKILDNGDLGFHGIGTIHTAIKNLHGDDFIKYDRFIDGEYFDESLAKGHDWYYEDRKGNVVFRGDGDYDFEETRLGDVGFFLADMNDLSYEELDAIASSPMGEEAFLLNGYTLGDLNDVVNNNVRSYSLIKK